jgi:hypothetical protein
VSRGEVDGEEAEDDIGIFEFGSGSEYVSNRGYPEQLLVKVV